MQETNKQIAFAVASAYVDRFHMNENVTIIFYASDDQKKINVEKWRLATMSHS